MNTWHASLAFKTQAPISDEAAFDLMEELANHGAAMSIERDNRGGNITLSIEANTALEASSEAIKHLLNHANTNIGMVDIVGIETVTDEALEAELATPIFPEVVSYAEIADLGGFSRQRARQLANGKTFPEAVISTAQGPLFSKHAIERWLETRDTKPGRPLRVNA